MKLFKKTTMSLALSAAMIGGMTMSQQASALPLGPGVVSAPGTTAYVNPNGIGQAIIFPYYTVRDQQKSFFNITNVTADTVAVKIRFHESLNSRDALDFIVILSPYDVWTGWIEDAEAAPVVRTIDKSCVAGGKSGGNDIQTNGLPLSNVAYTDLDPTFEDQPTNSIERTREGYMVAQVMGVVPGVKNPDGIVSGENETQALAINGNSWTGSVAYNAFHVDGVPRDCAAVNSAFVAVADQQVGTPPDFLDSDMLGDGDAKAILEFSTPVGATDGNPLRGNFSIINADNGVGAGQSALAIADMITVGTYGTTGTEARDTNLITAQNYPYFLEPTLASGDNLWTVTGLAAVELALTSAGLANEWAENAASGARADWVISFPTKAFHVDNRNSIGIQYIDPFVAPSSALTNPEPNIQAAANVWRVGSLALSGLVFEDNLNENGAEVKVLITGYDREEKGVILDSGDTTPSPFPPGLIPKVVLQGEANVVTFGPDDTATNGGNSALGAKNFVVNFDIAAKLNNGAVNGWANLLFTDTAATTALGLPAIGYVYKVRNQGDAALSFGQIMNHSWTALYPVTP